LFSAASFILNKWRARLDKNLKKCVRFKVQSFFDIGSAASVLGGVQDSSADEGLPPLPFQEAMDVYLAAAKQSGRYGRAGAQRCCISR
jgi:hypothetical protein